MNVHHIVQEADRGANSIENAICLCLRCHAEAGHFNSRHPMGTKYSPEELRAHRDQWWRHCEKSPEEPMGLFLDVGFRVAFRTADVHKYRLTISYRNTLKEAHEGWKIQIFFPAFVPVEVGDFDQCQVVLDSVKYTEIEAASNEKLFPGELIEIVPNLRDFFIEYEVNDRIHDRVLNEGSVAWKFYTSNAPIIEGERPLAEMQEF